MGPLVSESAVREAGEIVGVVRKRGSKQTATTSTAEPASEVVVPPPKRARKLSKASEENAELAAEVREQSAEAAKPGKKRTNPPMGMFEDSFLAV